MTKPIEDSTNAAAIRSALDVPTTAELTAVDDAAQAAASAAAEKYTKPVDGIPAADLTAATQARLAKADAALPGNASALADMLEAAPTADPASLARIQASVSGGAATSDQPALVALESKIARIGAGANALATVVVIGDSVSGDVAIPLLRPMIRMLSNAGVANGSEQAGWTTTLSGGAAKTTAPNFTRWPGGLWTEIPANGSMAYGWNNAHLTDYPLPASGVYKIGYLSTPGGGSFSIQDSPDAVTWTTLSTISTDAAAGFTSVSVSGTGGRRYMRLLGVSGTSAIVSWLVGGNSGYRSHAELSIGGSICANYMQAPSAVWDAYLQHCSPDLIFVYFKDDVIPSSAPALQALQDRIYANCPNADVVYIGPTQSQNDIEVETDPLYYQSAKAQRAVISSHVNAIDNMRAWYWDANKVWSTWAAGDVLGLFGDQVHPNDFGRQVLCEQFCSDFRLFQIPAGFSPWKFSPTALAAAGAFMATGGVISGATRIIDATDVVGNNESTGAGSLKTAGGFYAAKVIKSDTGLAIGTDLGTTATVNVSKSLATSAAWSTLAFTLNASTHTVAGNYNWTGFGGVVNVSYSGAVANGGHIRGGFAQVKESGSGTGNLSNVHGMFASAEMSGAHTVGNLSGSTVDLQSYGSGNIGTAYGVRLTANKGGASVVTNAFGVHIPASWGTFATNVWGFYNDSTAPSLSKGSWTWRPAASVNLAANGDLSFEATSNTALTVKYRGSDGVTRSAVLPLA